MGACMAESSWASGCVLRLVGAARSRQQTSSSLLCCENSQLGRQLNVLEIESYTHTAVSPCVTPCCYKKHSSPDSAYVLT
jgi:hypothetical protein